MEEHNPQSANPSPSASETPTPPVPPSPFSGDRAEDLTGIDPNKLMAAISYLGILVLIPLFVSRNDPFVRFHVKQGLVILVGYIIAVFAAAWIAPVGSMLWVLMLLASILGLIQSLQGKWWRIPGIAQLADKFRI